MKKLIYSFLVLFYFVTVGTSQKTYDFSFDIAWERNKITFEDAFIDYKTPQVPYYTYSFPVPTNGSLKIRIKPISTSPVLITDNASLELISEKYVTTYEVTQSRELHIANISILPIRKTKQGYEKIEAFDLNVEFIPSAEQKYRGSRNVTSSVLEEGDVYKFSISSDGAHKIDGKLLKDKFDITLGFASGALQLFGNPGGRLPRTISENRADDLLEMPIKIFDGGDGKFDEQDYFLFYAEGADEWTYNNNTKLYNHIKNIFSKTNFVFLKTNGTSGKRIVEKQSESTATYKSSEFDYLQVYENDKTNLLGTFVSTEGSGKDWYGDYFGIDVKKDFTDKFDISGIAQETTGHLSMKMAIRSDDGSSITVKVDEQELKRSVGAVVLNDIEAKYAHIANISEYISVTNNSKIEIEYIKKDTKDEAWLDYIKLEYRKQIKSNIEQQIIQDKQSLLYDKASFTIPNNIQIWDINELDEISIIKATNGQFSYDVDSTLKSFLLINNEVYFIPEPIQKISNQNVHGIEKADLVIVYHPLFQEAAKRLQDHRIKHSGYEVEIVDVKEIYNEFSSGRLDPSAIRDFAKMLYERDPKFKYLLLLGDGSYDYRNISPNLPDNNYIPVYETDESLDPIRGYPTDDFYALLGDSEGGNLNGGLELAVGRIPITDPDGANDIIDKIIKYDLGGQALGDWRTKIAFAADDGNTNRHFQQIDGIAENSEINDPLYTHTKVYFDSYVQESTPGGDRFPGASDAINNTIQKGALLISYMGHGGPKGWAQERVLKLTDIDTWTNDRQFPLLITATCSFTGYDDPAIVSAGEHAIRKKNGGVIALLTTVRAVYSNQNERLTKAVFSTIFKKNNGLANTFGDIMLNAKNANTSSGNVSNDRKFALIGDPSQRMALPQYNIATTSINGISVESNEIDTLNALEEVIIKGEVRNYNDIKVESFNGKLLVTVYDKESTLETLGNDNDSFKEEFEVYRNILFKG
ncbi:MAG: type IX secretion system sortase PorU, partial [Saprospiraceae bacterium]